MPRVSGKRESNRRTLRASTPDISEYDLTDEGTAERFVDLFNRRVRYSPTREEWYVWNTRAYRWSIQNAKYRVRQMFRKVAAEWKGAGETLLAECDDDKSPKARKGKAMLAHADRLGFRQRIESVLAYVGENPEIEVAADAFDSNPRALHCLNGVMELNPTGVGFRKSTRDDYATLNTGINYDPDARSELLDDYFKRFLPDRELRQFVQEVLGSSLLGSNPQRLLVFLFGPSSTGKSTVICLLQAVLGTYSQPFNMTLFRESKEERARTDIADALPRRVILAEETGSWNVLDADSIKRLTGNSPVGARRNYDKQSHSATPAFTPIIATNHPPKIRGADGAIDVRLLVLPFLNVIPPDENDEGRNDEMKADIAVREAFLAWLVDGYARYARRGGLPPHPAAVTRAKEKLKSSLTSTSEFLAEVCERAPENVCKTDVLFKVYRFWHKECAPESDRAVGIREFSNDLDAQSWITSDRLRKPESDSKIRVKVGVRVREEWVDRVLQWEVVPREDLL
jgi:putative DNA primase/helicase